MSKIIDINDKILKDYYESDIWDLTKHPNKEIAELHKKKFLKYRVLNFNTINSSNKKNELKHFFKYVFDKKSGLKYTTEKFINYYYLIPFANRFSENSFLDVDVDIMKELFLAYLSEIDGPKDAIKIITNISLHIYQAVDTRKGFERDVWDMSKMKINSERENKANYVKTLNFLNIHNIGNREKVKLWAKYLIGCTEYSISTIANFIYDVSIFFNDFGDCDASSIKSEDISELIDDWIDVRSAERIDGILKSVNKFYEYFEVRENSHMKSPVLSIHFQNFSYTPADNLVSENVILQLFRNMHTLPLQERCMLLINYSAGLRVSDICQIKTNDCLYSDNDGGFYINYFCQKMQKPQMNLIPPSLYKMIQEQQSAVGDSVYLFPSSIKESSPISRGSYSKRINTWIEKSEIKNDDGTPYRYRSHAFRHSLATDLLQNYNVDLQVIQLAVLGHKEIQMTLTYAQRSDEFNKSLHDKYIGNYGEFQQMDFEGVDGLHKKALGNGYCGYPSKLGTCPYSDACLHCEFFRTSKQFLDIHKRHLEEVQKNIVLFETNNWIHNLATAKETEKILLTIIEKLESL